MTRAIWKGDGEKEIGVAADMIVHKKTSKASKQKTHCNADGKRVQIGEKGQVAVFSPQSDRYQRAQKSSIGRDGDHARCRLNTTRGLAWNAAV